MKKILIPFWLSGYLLFSCTQQSNEKEQTASVSAIPDEHQHEDDIEAIERNHGEKWEVDSIMIAAIRHMETDVISTSADSVKDYKSLSEKLQNNISFLTSNCSMTGKAHDELHKWLLPYIDLVDELSEAKDKTEAAAQFAKIQTSFITFNQYFR